MENKERETKNLTYLVSTIIHYLSGMGTLPYERDHGARRPCKVAIAFRGHVVAHALALQPFSGLQNLSHMSQQQQ